MQCFDSDYMEGCHPLILKRLNEINFNKIKGYGKDEFCESAKEKIRKAFNCPLAEIFFTMGGTQTNRIVIKSLLQDYETVITADTGHITDHEAGAIESVGRKVTKVKSIDGKIDINDLVCYLENYYNDENNEHIVKPALVYISFSTEFGTIYSLQELKELRKVCDKYNLKLYLDGARLGYGIAASNDVCFADIASLCDVFYIGGTKVGALFGEAIVFTKKNMVPYFFTKMKRQGALLAKGWLLGLQFDLLFTDNLYLKISKNAVDKAFMLEKVLMAKGFKNFLQTTTNQKFVIVNNERLNKLKEKVSFSFWQKYDENNTVIRFSTSWATTEEQIKELGKVL